MADVLITHSYHLPFDPKQMRKMQPYPPLATLYAAAALRQNGISVVAFDSMLKDPTSGMIAALREHKPRVVAVYEDDFNFLSKMCLTRMREVAWSIAKEARSIGAITIAHGSDSTDNPGLFLNNGFDFVCCGEAEEALVVLCGSVLASKEIPDIDGLARLGPRGEVVRSTRRLAMNPKWNGLPLPARDLVDLEPYRAAWVQAHGYFSTNIVSGRGCPYHCNWCAKPISGNKFQLRRPEAVAEEMKVLKSDAGAQHLWFGDDIFALDREWTEQFANEVLKRDAVIPFKIQSRANLMTDQTVRHLKAAGCTEIWMGVESGSQRVLDSMDKGLKLHSVVCARDRLRHAGIRACYFLQFGYPGETWTELQQTIEFVRQTRPDDIGVSFSYPLPGTVFYERVREQLGYKRNWSDSDDLCIMYRAAYATGFYRAVRDALHAEVDSWSRHHAIPKVADEIAALWNRVIELEPISRDSNPLTSTKSGNGFGSSPVVPISELLTVRGA